MLSFLFSVKPTGFNPSLDGIRPSDTNFAHVSLLSPFPATVCNKSPPSSPCLSVPAGGWRDEGMGGRLGECRRRLCGAALSPRSLFCQPSATDQQSASQPCTDLTPLSLTLSLSPSLSLSSSISVSLHLAPPLCQRHLLSPCLLPTPTACPATNSACLSGNLPACFSVFCSACVSLSSSSSSSSSSPPVCLLLCLCAWVSACPSACLPASHSFQPIPPCRRAARLSAVLPICLTISPSPRHLFVSLFVCLFVCLPVYLSACPSVRHLFIVSVFICPSCRMSVCVKVIANRQTRSPDLILRELVFPSISARLNDIRGNLRY